MNLLTKEKKMGKTNEESLEKVKKILGLFSEEEPWTVKEVRSCLAAALGFVCFQAIDKMEYDLLKGDRPLTEEDKMDAAIEFLCDTSFNVLIYLIENQSGIKKIDKTIAKKIYQEILNCINERKTDG